MYFRRAIVGFLANGGVVRMGFITMMGYIIRRTATAMFSRNGTGVTLPPATEAVSSAEASAVAHPGPSLSGPTAGDAKEEEMDICSSCQSYAIVIGNNLHRPTASQSGWKRDIGPFSGDIASWYFLALSPVVEEARNRAYPDDGVRRETDTPAVFW